MFLTTAGVAWRHAMRMVMRGGDTEQRAMLGRVDGVGARRNSMRRGEPFRSVGAFYFTQCCASVLGKKYPFGERLIFEQKILVKGAKGAFGMCDGDLEDPEVRIGAERNVGQCPVVVSGVRIVR